MKALIVVFSLLSIALGCQDSGCPNGQSCNPYTNQCVVDPPEPARPAAWLGDAPDFCNRVPDDCKRFALEYDISHPKGDGEFCQNGTKIRCLMPEYKPTLEETPEHEIRVIAYNTFERSFSISWDGQRERTCRIPIEIIDNNKNVDVITFQEVFMGGCFAESLDMRKMLTYYGFPHFTELLDSEETASNGGIFIASKWPIVEQDMLIYNASDPNTWDYFAAKGVSYAKVQKRNTFYHVTGTHMQAGGSSEIKPKQCEEAAEFLKSKSIPLSEAIIYSGDFNLNQWGNMQYMRMCLNSLDAVIPPNNGPLNATSDPNTNDVLNLTTSNPRAGSWLDYVLPNVVHRKPLSALQTVLKPMGTPAFPICWCEQCIPLDPDYIYPDDEDCDRVERVRDLSDHYPVLGTFIYEEN